MKGNGRPQNTENPDLWIDAPDALEQLDRKRCTGPLREDLINFIKNGYAILPGAVSHDDVDAIVADTEEIYRDGGRFVLKNKGAYVDPTAMTKLGPGHRVVDVYAISEAARRAIFSDRLSALLQTIFESPAIAMQSISFEFGSQQAIHQDTAYVVSGKPLALAAVWIALEDIQEGTGELIYYPGGHRFDPYWFGGGRRHWIPASDGQQAHQEFLAGLHAQARARGICAERFLAKKGDVFVWHADLPHGGSRIVKDMTRRSLVVHYVPIRVKANYHEVLGKDYFELASSSGDFFTSRHYLLSRLDSAGRAQLLYDGGVTKRRNIDLGSRQVTR